MGWCVGVCGMRESLAVERADHLTEEAVALPNEGKIEQRLCCILALDRPLVPSSGAEIFGIKSTRGILSIA